MRVAALDQEVERRKPSRRAGAKGKALDLPEPEPWPEPVDGAELIAGLVEQIARYVILSEHAALAVALWTLHAHAHDTAFHSPRLTATSPTMRCGKSTLLRTISRLVPRPLPTANITPAAMFRVVEGAKPTLLIDEADSFVHENEELRGVINSSHCCLDAYVVRAVPAGDDMRPGSSRPGHPWRSPRLARSRRRSPTGHDDRHGAQGAGAVGRPDASSTVTTASACSPARPPGGLPITLRRCGRPTRTCPRALNDRQADNWRPLFAIADLAGDDWPTPARALRRWRPSVPPMKMPKPSACRCSPTSSAGRFGSYQGRSRSPRRLAAAPPCHAEAPWGEYGRQRKPISPRPASRAYSALKPFCVAVRQVWKPEAKANKNGYVYDSSSPAWGRYLSSKCLETTDPAACSDLPSSSDEGGTEDEYPPKPAGTASSQAFKGQRG